jgi:hypothetical protein
MRVIDRLRLFCLITVLVVGFVFSISLAFAATIGSGCGQSWRCDAGVFNGALFLGSILTGAGIAVVLRLHPPEATKDDLAGWERWRAERRLRSARAMWKRVALRAALWAPSAIAAAGLVFIPVATHVTHPRSRYLRHYRVPIPWNTTVLSGSEPPFGYGWAVAFVSNSRKGRFGVTPYLDSEPLSSEMVFGSRDPHGETIYLSYEHTSWRAKPVQESWREIRVGGVAVSCWQYAERRGIGAWDSPGPLRWYVSCGTPVDVRERNMYAWFAGRESDVPMFYRIVEGVRAVD